MEKKPAKGCWQWVLGQQDAEGLGAPEGRAPASTCTELAPRRMDRSRWQQSQAECGLLSLRCSGRGLLWYPLPLQEPSA